MPPRTLTFLPRLTFDASGFGPRAPVFKGRDVELFHQALREWTVGDMDNALTMHVLEMFLTVSPLDKNPGITHVLADCAVMSDLYAPHEAIVLAFRFQGDAAIQYFPGAPGMVCQAS